MKSLSLVEQAVCKGTVQSIRLFAKSGKLSIEKQGIPLTILAATLKDVQMMQALVENNLNINMCLSNNPSITPLSVAVATGNHLVVDYLLSQHCGVSEAVLAIETSHQIKELFENYQEKKYENK